MTGVVDLVPSDWVAGDLTIWTGGRVGRITSWHQEESSLVVTALIDRAIELDQVHWHCSWAGGTYWFGLEAGYNARGRVREFHSLDVA